MIAHRRNAQGDAGGNFARLALKPGGLTRDRAVARASEALNDLAPRLAVHIHAEGGRLVLALLRADQSGPDAEANAAFAYHCSVRLRDIACTMGFPMIGLVASNLCDIFEALEGGTMPFPRAIVACHRDALRLLLLPQYRKKQPADLPELSEGLRAAAAIVTARGDAARRAAR